MEFHWRVCRFREFTHGLSMFTEAFVEPLIYTFILTQ